MSRTLHLYDNISKETVRGIIAEIIRINEEDDEISLNDTKYERKPIKLYVTSGGGNIFDGLCLANVIHSSKTPVHAYIPCYAGSSGFTIAISAHRRFAHINATFTYHDGSTDLKEIKGKLEDVELYVAEIKRIKGLCDELIVKQTSLNQKLLDEIKSKRIDWFLPAESALELGIVHEIFY
jgi:ATP-dependent protease ClpP protease subunit